MCLICRRGRIITDKALLINYLNYGTLKLKKIQCAVKTKNEK